MPTVQVERIYLEMRSPPEFARSATASLDAEGAGGAALRLEHVRPCPVPLFRRLYRDVGAAHHWRDRDAWSDEQLARHLARDAVEVWVLWDGGEPAGFFELARHPDASTEIAYFGLASPWIGKGLGRLMLTLAVEAAWRGAPARVWLHTCSLDSPAALPNYLARGFRPFGRETYEAELPD